MLSNWEEHELTKELDKVQMIQYCVLEWPKKKIRKDGLKWPKYGSSGPWLCKTLYLYLHYKGAKQIDQLPYARVWLKYWNNETNEKIFALKGKQKEITEPKIDDEQNETKRKLNQSRMWDPLDMLPPASSPKIGRESDKEGQSTCEIADTCSSPHSSTCKNSANWENSHCVSPSPEALPSRLEENKRNWPALYVQGAQAPCQNLKFYLFVKSQWEALMGELDMWCPHFRPRK